MGLQICLSFREQVQPHLTTIANCNISWCREVILDVSFDLKACLMSQIWCDRVSEKFRHQIRLCLLRERAENTDRI